MSTKRFNKESPKVNAKDACAWSRRAITIHKEGSELISIISCLDQLEGPPHNMFCLMLTLSTTSSV